MSQRFTAWIDPAAPVPESASDHYAPRRADVPWSAGFLVRPPPCAPSWRTMPA